MAKSTLLKIHGPLGKGEMYACGQDPLEGNPGLPIAQEHFRKAGESADAIAPQKQLLIFHPHDFRDSVAVVPKPLYSSHPGRVGEKETPPWRSADLAVRPAERRQSD